MTTIDPERERRRLTELYRSMSDEELEAIADDGKSLSDTAREALTKEIQARHLSLTVQLAETGSNELEPRDLVTIRRFVILHEALLAQSRLSSAGIESFLADDNMGWLIVPNAVEGARLLVDRADADAAVTILDQPIGQDFEVEGLEEYQAPRCPECGSQDLKFQRAQKSWICCACRHVWEQEAED